MGSSPIVHPILERLRRGAALLALFIGACTQVSPATGDEIARLLIAGDSTAENYQGSRDQQGWGRFLSGYFDASRLRVVNMARGGRSSRTFVTSGQWDRVLEQVRGGDFVIIQFGHNDSGALNEEPPESKRPLRARGTIPGTGPKSEEIDNVITGKRETVYSFGWYLRKMIADTRARGATPILLSLTSRNLWRSGRIECPSETYRRWAHETAVAHGVPFVDLTRIIADRYQRSGRRAVNAQFGGDAIHTNATGANANAADVVAGLRALRDLPFDTMLSDAGRAVAADSGPAADSVCPRLPAG